MEILILAPVVHETLEVLEEHVLVFVQDPLDRIPATWEEVSENGGVTGNEGRGAGPGWRSACPPRGSCKRGSLWLCANGLRSVSPVIDSTQALGLVNS